MHGDILYPLNELKGIYPNIYAEAIEKYTGRESVMEQRIPRLDCLWNDVVHLSAVHPKVVDDALIELGSHLPARRFFVIDSHSLENEKTIVYLYQHHTRAEKLTLTNFTKYDPNDLEKLAVLPEETKSYYKEALARGERPLFWHRVPHILYKGSIDIRDCEVIEI
jgi:hypothetical protein